MTYTDVGLLLRREPYREYDEYLTFYLKTHGKCSALAVGSRRVTSKLSGTLAPFCYLSLSLARGRRVDRVVGAEVLTPLLPLRSNLTGRLLAMLTARAVEGITTQEGDERTLALTWRTWSAASEHAARGTLTPPVAQFFFSSFVFKQLTLAGLKPDLSRCAQCGNEFLHRVPSSFSSLLGGFLCQRHGQAGKAISPECARAAATLIDAGEREGKRGGNQGTATYELGRDTLSELVTVAADALDFHIQKPLPTRDVFGLMQSVA